VLAFQYFIVRISGHLLIVYIESGQSLEGGDWHIGDQCVEFVGGVLIFVPLPGQTNAKSEGNVPKKQISTFENSPQKHKTVTRVTKRNLGNWGTASVNNGPFIAKRT